MRCLVLLVDDELDLLELYALMLETNGYEVAKAVNGEEAVKIYRELLSESKKPDIIIMDYRMPRKNGIEAAQEILAESRTVIIFSSADESIVPQVKKLGARFMKKPFSFEALRKGIESAQKEVEQHNI